MRLSRFSVGVGFGKWLLCTNLNGRRSQTAKPLLFQGLNYAKQVNKTGTGAFQYQSVKHGDILNQQAAGDRGGETTDEKCFDLVPSKNSLNRVPDNHTFYTELGIVQSLTCVKLYWNVSRAFHRFKFAVKIESCLLKGAGGGWNR